MRQIYWCLENMHVASVPSSSTRDSSLHTQCRRYNFARGVRTVRRSASPQTVTRRRGRGVSLSVRQRFSVRPSVGPSVCRGCVLTARVPDDANWRLIWTTAAARRRARIVSSTGRFASRMRRRDVTSAKPSPATGPPHRPTLLTTASTELQCILISCVYTVPGAGRHRESPPPVAFLCDPTPWQRIT